MTGLIIFLAAFYSLTTQAQVYESAGQKFKVEILTERDDVVWGFDFLPKDRIIFTERGGAIGVLDLNSRKVTAVKGAPKVWAKGQGGMLDIRVLPSDSKKIYITYSEPVNGGATTALAQAELSETNELVQFKKLFSAHEPNRNHIHFGSRIEFDGKGHVFFTVGDRNDRPKVQDLGYHLGKVLRLNLDGSIPPDNPFVNRKGAKPEIWSYGHRSPQGLVLRPSTDELWLAEMGPKGGDEVNWIRPGKNYGWPDVTYGREYYGPKIGVTSKPGTEPPVVYWVPSISPSAMTFYNGDQFPGWKGNAFLACLSGQQIRRLVFKGRTVTHQEKILEDLNFRFRNLRTGPSDGYLYFSTDSGQIGRLIPVM